MPQLKIDDDDTSMSPEQFFAWHEHQEKRFELIDGLPVMQPKMQIGASRKHDRVTMNALLSFGNQLRGKPCEANTADVAIQIPAGNIRYPDVSIDCGVWRPEDKTANKPVLVLEVLSPSTMRMDTIHKVEEYKSITGLQAIILVSTVAFEVTLYTRSVEQSLKEGSWTMEIVKKPEDVMTFDSFGVALSLADLYEEVLPSEDD